MRAKDLMTPHVVKAKSDMSVSEVAALLLKHRVSALPVVDAGDRVIGIVSEGDLLHRVETGTERRRSWWLRLFETGEAGAQDFIKSHASKVADVMTREVVCVEEDASAGEIAQILEDKHIKRVPVVRNRKLIGIVSRADLLRALAVMRPKPQTAPVADDATIREAVLKRLAEQKWIIGTHLNVIVTGGVVHLWGLVDSETERRAMRIAAESVPGVRRVEDHLTPVPPMYGGV